MPRMSSMAARPSSTKSSGVRLEAQFQALTLEDRKQLFHRSPELRLTGGRGLGASVEHGVHDPAAQLDRDLDGALPVADGSLALVLVRAGPLVQRENRGDLHAG